ncbi:GNAT family N-acetyltransferase [Streptacidiphilus cavernicola]
MPHLRPGPRPGAGPDDHARPGAHAGVHPGTVPPQHHGEPPPAGSAAPTPSPAPAAAPPRPRAPRRIPAAELLDGVGRWGATDTRVGRFRLQPVRLPRDLALVVSWMNDPVVAAFWELAGPAELTEHHIAEQLDGDGRSVPCLGLLDETPMSYWEVYRADLDPLSWHYPALPHDTGLHLLLGPPECRGRGLGPVLLRAVADQLLTERHSARRVVAEPDVRNIPSVRAFLGAGFRHARDLVLPAKRAALMVYERPPR